MYVCMYVCTHTILSEPPTHPISHHKKVFYHVLHVMNDPQTFGYASLQKYFFNIQWQRENIQTLILSQLLYVGSPYSIMTKVLGCSNLSFKDFTFGRVHTFGKGMNPFILASHGLNSTTTVLIQGWLWH